MDNRAAQFVTFEESGHIAYKCSGDNDSCERGTCQFCQGGLFACNICGCFEGATTTHCPGIECYKDKGDLIYAGKLDYRDGKWVEIGSPHTPNKGWEFYAGPDTHVTHAEVFAGVTDYKPKNYKPKRVR